MVSLVQFLVTYTRFIMVITGHHTWNALLPAHGAEEPAADDDTKLSWAHFSHEVLH